MSGVTTCILTAMPEEAAPFIDELRDKRAVEAPLQAEALVGNFHGHDVALITCGIGLVAAASACTWAIDKFAPRQVISAGSCGGLAAATNVGDIAVSVGTTYGTADATEFGYERGQVPQQPLVFTSDPALVAAARRAAGDSPVWHFGRILSGDTFVTAKNVADMRETFADAVAADMESCALGQTCQSFGVPFVSIRSVSDLCGPAADQEFHIGIDIAAQNSKDAVLTTLHALA